MNESSSSKPSYSVNVQLPPLVVELAALGTIVVLGVAVLALVSHRLETPQPPVATSPAAVLPAANAVPVPPLALATERAPVAECDIPHAMDLWKTCDPVPRTHEGWDVALLSGEAGILEVSTYPMTRLRIDGRNYNIRVGGDTRVSRLPITPGHHVIDFVSDAYTFAVRKDVTVAGGETTRMVLDLRDHMPEPVVPASAMGAPSHRGGDLGGADGSWYVGTSNGRPVFTNLASR